MKTMTCGDSGLVVRIILPSLSIHNRGDDRREVFVDDAALPVSLVVNLHDCYVAGDALLEGSSQPAPDPDAHAGVEAVVDVAVS
jgi:hypothetical protein